MRALCRGLSPFGGMKDVRAGTFEQRMAAHRHNRRLRGALWACMLRWAASCGVALGLAAHFESLGSAAASPPPSFNILIAAACATFSACGLCVLFVSAYVYVHLAHDK